jgi:hypothetical protein
MWYRREGREQIDALLVDRDGLTCAFRCRQTRAKHAGIVQLREDTKRDQGERFHAMVKSTTHDLFTKPLVEPPSPKMGFGRAAAPVCPATYLH